MHTQVERSDGDELKVILLILIISFAKTLVFDIWLDQLHQAFEALQPRLKLLGKDASFSIVEQNAALASFANDKLVDLVQEHGKNMIHIPARSGTSAIYKRLHDGSGSGGLGLPTTEYNHLSALAALVVKELTQPKATVEAKD